MFFGGIFWFIFVFLFLGALVLAGVALAGRRDEDPGFRRPFAMYVLAVIFLSLVVLVTAGGTIASNITHVIIDEDTSGSVEECIEFGGGTECVEGIDLLSDDDVDLDNARWAEVIRATITAIVTALILRLHWGAMQNISVEQGAARRTYGNYLYLTCFVALVTALTALVIAVYSLVQIIIPGVVAVGSDDVERDKGILGLVTSLVVGGAAGVIFRYHWDRTVPFRNQLDERPA